jgi:hypothetical protein
MGGFLIPMADDNCKETALMEKLEFLDGGGFTSDSF